MCKSCERKKMTENAPEKHMCLKLQDAKADLFAIVDNLHTDGNIPFYLLESIVSDLSRQVKSCADAERSAAMQTYNKQFATERGDGGDGN